MNFIWDEAEQRLSPTQESSAGRLQAAAASRLNGGILCWTFQPPRLPIYETVPPMTHACGGLTLPMRTRSGEKRPPALP